MTPEQAVQIILIALVTFAVTAGLKSLSKLVNRDLSGIAVPLTAACVALVVTFSPSLWALVPAQYQFVVGGVVIALAGTVAAAGVSTIKPPQPPSAPAA